MQPPAQPRGISQLIWIAVASNVLIIAGFVALTSLSWHLGADRRLTLSAKLPWLAGILFGNVGTMVAELALSRGLKKNRWSDSLVTHWRTILTHPSISALSWILMIGLATSLAFSLTRPTPGTTWIFLAVPCQMVNRIRTLLREPVKPLHSGGSTLFPAQPLQSGHWGSPPRPHVH